MISKTGSLEAGQRPGWLIPLGSFRGTIEDPGASQLSALPSAHSPHSPATCPPGYKTAAGAPAIASFLHISLRQINLHQKPHTTLPFAISLLPSYPSAVPKPTNRGRRGPCVSFALGNKEEMGLVLGQGGPEARSMRSRDQMAAGRGRK